MRAVHRTNKRAAPGDAVSLPNDETEGLRAQLEQMERICNTLTQSRAGVPLGDEVARLRRDLTTTHRFYQMALRSPYLNRLLLWIDRRARCDGAGAFEHDPSNDDLYFVEFEYDSDNETISKDERGDDVQTHTPVHAEEPDDENFMFFIRVLQLLGYTVVQPRPSHDFMSPHEISVYWLQPDGEVSASEKEHCRETDTHVVHLRA